MLLICLICLKDAPHLASINISHFNTQNVETMNGMFDGCSSLTSIDLSILNTSNVKDMTFMFGSASNTDPMSIADLTPLKDWDVSNVESFYQPQLMF